MYEKLDTCPICDSHSFSNYLICTDHSITHESFALVRCNNCSHIFTNPRPSEQEIAKFYDSPTYISHSQKSSSLITPIYQLAKLYTFKWKHSIISQHTKRSTVLDYGAGTGDFMHYLQKKNWTAHGIEPNTLARNKATAKGLTVYPSFNKANQQKYDVITAWHSIEHVHQLKETLQALRKRSHDATRMYIALPNPLSHDAIHYKEFWAGYDVPRHIHHFTADSIEKLLTKTRLRLQEIIPMKLDSFYVSILSEQYKKSRFPFLSGIRTALRSNQSARTTRQYSSNIYVITR